MLNHIIILIKSQTNEQIDKWLFGGDAPAGNSHAHWAVIVIALTRPVT